MASERSNTSTFVAVFVALLVLLALTVAAAEFDLGSWNFPIAFAIAATKAILIVTVFMEVRRSTPLVRLVVAAGVSGLVILLTFSFADYLTRGWLPGFHRPETASEVTVQR